MPLVAGLAPDPENNPPRSGLPAATRVVPNDRLPDPQRLQPVASPVDTYVRPMAPRKDNELTRLAETLQSLNPALAKWGDTVARDQHQDLPGRVAKVGGALTGQARIDAIRADPDLNNKLGERLVGGQVGANVADSTSDRLTQDLYGGKFDFEKGSLDEFAKPYLDADFKQYSSADPNFNAQYKERFDARLGVLRADIAKRRTEAAQNEQEQLISGTFKSTIQSGIDRSEQPGAIVENVRQQLFTNKAFQNKPVPEQEKLLVGVLQRMSGEIEGSGPRADALFGVVKAFAEAPRIDPVTRQNMGSLKDSTTLGGVVADTLKRAESAYNQQDQNNQWKDITSLTEAARKADPDFPRRLDETIARKPQWFPQNERTRMLESWSRAREGKQAELEAQRAEEGERAATNATTTQALAAGTRGELHELRDVEILDKSGRPKVITADAQVQAATDQRMRQIDELAKTNPKDTRTPFEQKARWFTENPQALNEQWRTLLRAGPSGAATATMTNGKVVSPATASGYQLYKDLRAAAPNLLEAHTDERSRAFYERVRVAEEIQHLPVPEALALASRATNDPTGAVTEPISPREFNEKAKTALSRFWSADVTDTSNSREAYGRLRQAAENLVKGNGLSWDEAIKQAATNVEKDFTVINGMSVLTADKRVPKDFGRVANKFFNGWLEANREALAAQHIERSDLAMVNVNGTANWRVVLKSTMGDPGVEDSGVSLQDLYGTVKSLADQDKIRAQRKAVTTLEDRQAGVFDNVETMTKQLDGGVYVIGDPFSGKLLSRSNARTAIEQLKANPDYEAGRAVKERRRSKTIGNASYDALGNLITR